MARAGSLLGHGAPPLTAPRLGRDGIRFQGLRYMDTTLAGYVGEPELIRYDPRDLAEIRVFHGNEFVSRAICPELAGSVISLKDLVAARKKRRRELRARRGRQASGGDFVPGACRAHPELPSRSRVLAVNDQTALFSTTLESNGRPITAERFWPSAGCSRG